VLKPRIISEVSVRYRARSSRFFPAVLGQARPPSIDARRSISVVVLSCSVLQGGAPRINSEVSAEVSARYTRYRTRSSQFFLAVFTAGTPAVRRAFGLGRCVAVVCGVPFSRAKGGAPRKAIISEVSVRSRTRSSRFFPAMLGRARPPFGLGRCVAVCHSQGRSPPQINSEVSVRYRTRSSRFFPACSVLTSSQGRSPRQINFEVSVRYLTRSSRFFPAVSGRARPLFGLGHCAGMFRSQGRSPANRFRGQCPLYPLPYPIVPVLSRCVGAGTPAVRSWSLCCRVPFSREEPPANQFRGQCPLPYRIVPVLSRCAMRCGSPSVRVATTLWCAFRATTASQLHHQLRP
jgi:hypothetical protein